MLAPLFTLSRRFLAMAHVVKWSAGILTIVFVIAFAFSLYWWIGFVWGRWWITSESGGLGIELRAIAGGLDDGFMPINGPWMIQGRSMWQINWFPSGGTDPLGIGHVAIMIPWWMMIIAAGVAWYFAWYHSRTIKVRQRRGMCLRCGYQLPAHDAHVHSAICSECGYELKPDVLGDRPGAPH